MKTASYNQLPKNMKILLPLLSIFYPCLAHAQNINYEQTVQFIQNKVSCCSVPFKVSGNKKVDNITIDGNGNISLSYSDKSAKTHFNLFKLYKDEQSETGIDTILGGKFIQFNVNENKARLIKFATAGDAKEVYKALLKLLEYGKIEATISGSLNFQQTIDEINARLGKWAERGNLVTVSALDNGNIDIVNRLDQHQKFNLFDLDDDDGSKMNGIVIKPCDLKAHAPLAWINFKKAGKTIAFIRLSCNTAKTELDIIRSAFLQLKLLSIKTGSLKNWPADAAYFISRNAILNTENKMLANSIRSVDTTDGNGIAITVNSRGEGWLNKDSLPTGQWNFYAKSSTGKEYLFKTGLYQLTNPGMFEVMDIDSADLAKKYHLSIYSLQQQQAQMIPFVKVKSWEYYYADGKSLKKVVYKHHQIPVSTSIVMMDPENMEHTRLVINLKENMDEWE
jgi:hypothetical protein